MEKRVIQFAEDISYPKTRVSQRLNQGKNEF